MMSKEIKKKNKKIMRKIVIINKFIMKKKVKEKIKM